MSPLESVEESRKLIFPTTMEGVSLVILRGSDVPTYVRHGAADVGVVGKDLLMDLLRSLLRDLLRGFLRDLLEDFLRGLVLRFAFCFA